MQNNTRKNNLFGDSLREVMADTGISSRELAANLDVAEFDLSRILSGTTRPPKKVGLILTYTGFNEEQRQALKAAYAQEAICRVVDDPEVLIVPRNQKEQSNSKTVMIARAVDQDKELARASRVLMLMALSKPHVRSFVIQACQMLAIETKMTAYPSDLAEDIS